MIEVRMQYSRTATSRRVSKTFSSTKNNVPYFYLLIIDSCDKPKLVRTNIINGIVSFPRLTELSTITIIIIKKKNVLRWRSILYLIKLETLIYFAVAVEASQPRDYYKYSKYLKKRKHSMNEVFV